MKRWQAHRVERVASYRATNPNPRAQWHSGRNVEGDARIPWPYGLLAHRRNSPEAESRQSHTSRTSSLRRICQRGIQLAAGTREGRHHGANGNRRDRSDLLVGTPFELSKDKNFAEARGQHLEGHGETLALIADNCECFRRGAGLQV